MAAELTADVTHYVSQTRAKGIRTGLFHEFNPSAAPGERLGCSFSLSADAWTEWVIVSDDDPRAETFERSGH